MTAVTVTAQHIKTGIPDNVCRCPIALATLQLFPSAIVRVNPAEVMIWASGARWCSHVDLPPRAREFAAAFDRGDPVEPFTFDLDYPAVTS